MNKGFNNYQTLGVEQARNGAPNRSIPQRVDAYCLMKYLNKHSRVLDIGCNRGFFGVYLSEKIAHYTGIDHDKNELSHGRKLVTQRNIGNVTLVNTEFESFAGNNFDAVFSFAVHAYVKMAMCDYASKINGLLNHGGYVFVEGHPKGYMGEPKKLKSLTELFRGHFKYNLIMHKNVLDRKNIREFYIWQKSGE